MISSRGCAVIAAAFPGEAQRLRDGLSMAGFSGIVCVQDGLSALRLVQSRLPEALIADAVLPGLDGVSLAKRIQTLALNRYPATALMTLPGMCPAMPSGCARVEKPARIEALLAALDGLRPEKREIPAGKHARALEILASLGVPEHCGRDYLCRAAEIVWQDAGLARSLSARLYPALAEEFGQTPKHIDRAMRHVIDMAWRGGEIEAQYDLFGDTIDAGRGSPTLSEMIARIADILRWEGKA